MKQATRERLNALNRAFYDAHAAEFSDKRTRPWRGFGRVLEHARDTTVRVLDIGCGNGRLVPALQQRFDSGFEYLGIDASEALLAIARARYSGEHVSFASADFVSELPERALPASTHSLVCMFGVLHHVPGEAERRALLQTARTRVAQGGLLAFTLWRFDRDPRSLRRRVADSTNCADDELEPGDALLRWGERDDVVRYCHLIEAAELERLLAGSDLVPIDRFPADGANNDLNEYLVLRAP